MNGHTSSCVAEGTTSTLASTLRSKVLLKSPFLQVLPSRYLKVNLLVRRPQRALKSHTVALRAFVDRRQPTVDREKHLHRENFLTPWACGREHVTLGPAGDVCWDLVRGSTGTALARPSV